MATEPSEVSSPRAQGSTLFAYLFGALARLFSARNLKNDRFGTIAAILGVAVGAAMVSVVAILDVNTTRIEAVHAAATATATEKGAATVTLVGVRGGVPLADVSAPRGAAEDSEVLRTGIRVGSLSAFLLGALIVFFTFSAGIDRRLRELGLLRSLGAVPAQIAAIFLREAALVGLAGGALGFVAAIPTAYVAAGAGITTTGHLKIDPRAMVFPWATMLLIAAFGSVVAVLGALRPIRRIARVDLARALCPAHLTPTSASPAEARRRRVRLLAAPLLVLALLALRPLAERSLSPVAFHGLEAIVIAATFLAVLVLAPALVRRLGSVVVRVLPAGSGAERLLTRRRIERGGDDLAWSVSGVMMVFALLLTLHIVTNALKREVIGWADGALTDETFVLPWYPKLRADTVTATLPPSATVAYFTTRTPWPNALHATHPEQIARLAEESGRPDHAAIARRLSPGTILLSTLLARRLGVREGDAVDVSAPSVTRRLTVVGVTDGVGFTPMNASHRKARTYGVIDAADQDLIAPWVESIGAVAIVAHASDPAITAWRGAEASQLVTTRGVYRMPALFYKNLRLREANSDFLIFDLLLLLISILAAVGIANQLVLSVRARERELLLYRVLGMTAAQVRRLLLLEGAFIGLLGGALAVLLAIPLGVAALGALRAITGFAVTFSLPPLYVVATVALAVVVSTLASLYPAARAAKNSAASSLQIE